MIMAALPRPLVVAPVVKDVRSRRILPFARFGALLPGDREAIARFTAQQHRAQLQFAELDQGRTVALIELGVSVRRVRIERHGATVIARLGSGEALLKSDSIDALLSAMSARLSISGPAASSSAELGGDSLFGTTATPA